MSEVNVPTGWGVAGESVLDLPSGSKVRIRELDIPELIAMGALDLVDQFTQKAVPPEDTNPTSVMGKIGDEILKDPERLKKVVEVMNQIAAQSVIEPKVHYLSPDSDEAPEKGKVYAHLIPFEDRMAIFERAVSSLGQFPADSDGQAEDVADPSDGENVQPKAKRAPRNRKS